MVAKKYQNPSGGLNEAGRKYFKNKDGSNLKRPQSTGKDGRRISFASRFAGMKGPERDSKGKPTRLLLALRKWGFRSKESARKFSQRNKKT
tara:strand:+ start:1605 stop:1877 length:273 start_codon:yes stop_codon:yes gene_type:complete